VCNTRDQQLPFGQSKINFSKINSGVVQLTQFDGTDRGRLDV